MNLLTILLSIVVSASIDSTELWVGDQSTLHMQALQDKETIVDFPVYGEELIPGIEVVARSERDTTEQADGRIIVKQDLTITSFADSLFYIEPIPFVSDGDTFLTDPLTLNVIQPFEIDTAANAITDIKPIYRAPIWWWGIIRWILLGLGIVALGIGVYYLVIYIKAHWGHKEEAEEEINPELLRPAEEVALEKLDKIKAEKIWQQGRQKDYYTELTDVVREYIARRFEITAEEKTSDEILRELKPLLQEQKELYTRLKDMLRLADLVKFAKWNALPDENEISLLSAYQFVRDTTPTPPEDPTPEPKA